MDSLPPAEGPEKDEILAATPRGPRDRMAHKNCVPLSTFRPPASSPSWVGLFCFEMLWIARGILCDWRIPLSPVTHLEAQNSELHAVP